MVAEVPAVVFKTEHDDKMGQGEIADRLQTHHHVVVFSLPPVVLPPLRDLKCPAAHARNSKLLLDCYSFPILLHPSELYPPPHPTLVGIPFRRATSDQWDGGALGTHLPFTQG